MSFEAAVHAQAIDIDRLSLEMCAAAGSGHPSSAMSIGHIVTVLLFHSMRWSPDHPDYPTSDRLVLSEGHAVPAVYAAFARLGGKVGRNAAEWTPLTVDDLTTLRDVESVLEGHPNPGEGFPFFDAATGSLGQGLSTAAGIAEAARLDGVDRRVYCIIGDGESREGQVAEALDYIAERGLNQVLPIFNCNGHGQAGRVSDQQSPDRLQAKLEATGFEVRQIDGHDPAQIREAFEAFVEVSGVEGRAPLAVVARTVKGWGAEETLTGNWHGKPPVGDTRAKAIEELERRRADLTSSLVQADHFEIRPPAAAPAPTETTLDIPSFSQAMRNADMEAVWQGGRFATRKAYGLALRELGKASDRIVVLDADVSNSTFAETFKRDPELASRFLECRIAEQNMISMGVGLSAAGKIPFCSSFAKFITRGYDQLEMAVQSECCDQPWISRIGGAVSGPTSRTWSISPPAPGMRWMRAFTTLRDRRGNPGMYILQPADAYAAYALTNVMAEYEGVCYMRTGRPDVEFLYSDDAVFNLGGFEVLSEGRDIMLVASGYMVHEANKALEALDRQGIAATVVDLYSLPFDGDALLDLANENNGYVLTLEDNYGASIGSAVADVMTDSGDAFTLRQMHVARLPKSARTPEEELDYVGLATDDIVRTSLNMLEVGVA